MMTALLDFLFPPRCPGCREYRESWGDWCPACEKKYVARRLFLESEGKVEAVMCLALYEGTVKELLHRLKFRRDEGALPYLTRLMERAWIPELPAGDPLARFLAYLGDGPVFLPVALHPVREKERGFNQTVLLWRDFLTGKGFQWLEALERRKETKPQYSLTKREREENVRGAFALRAECRPQLKGRPVVLVDDIYTSGATLKACAQALRGTGAERVLALTLATGRTL